MLHPEPCDVVLHAPDRGGWLHFRRPERIITTGKVEDVLPALGEIERLVSREGKFAAGFVAYEAAPAFEPAMRVRAALEPNQPLLWFGIYAQPERLPADVLGPGTSLLPGPWQPDIHEEAYWQAIEQIKEHIAGGETYQVNYTYRLRSPFSLPPWPLFAALASAHAAGFAAFLETEAWALCSISPELFFDLEGETLTSRPMKGTAPRGATLDQDEAMAGWLARSEKNRAENVMIVDMVRNDLGRIARTGSVRVPELFRIEKYPTVWQMTSCVQAETDAGLDAIFQSLFPCASITGAPKIKTMEIIAELEASRRGVYCGAIGYYAPGRKAQFNVAIRTLWIDKTQQRAEYGVGGGIVWDSGTAEEWEETRTKARILHELPQPFELLETMLWSPEKRWFLLEKHLARLARSAEYFSFRLDLADVRDQLSRLAMTFPLAQQQVRLKLAKDGSMSLEHQAFSASTNPTRVGIARDAVQSTERFLYHKTTRREIYRRALQEAHGCEEVLLWNERGELTEACIANLVVELDGKLYTPPVECGLLPGTYRAWLLEQGRVAERVLPLSELGRYSRILLINSVREMWEVTVGSCHEQDDP